MRCFDERRLELCRWVSERYVAPLAAVLGRATPPRVAGEEGRTRRRARRGRSVRRPVHRAVLEAYRERPGAARAPIAGRRAASACVAAPGARGRGRGAGRGRGGAALGAGRRALVVVPEADAGAGDRGGDRRGVRRSRGALLLAGPSGRGTGPGSTSQAGPLRRRGRDASGRVRAACPTSGSIVVARESHPAHREDRAPYYHVRDVALARGRDRGGRGACCRAICPSSEAAALGAARGRAARGAAGRPSRSWRPGPRARAHGSCGRSGDARRAFLFSPLPGYGIAAVCRTCGEPAACAACGGAAAVGGGTGPVRGLRGAGPCRALRRRRLRAAPGRRGARRGVGGARGRRCRCAGSARTTRRGSRRRARCSSAGPTTSATSAPGGLDLVADPRRRPRRRAGRASRRASARVTTWMEADRVGAARRAARSCSLPTPNDPAVQALVQGEPAPVPPRRGAQRRAQAGFPVGAAVFRVAGDERARGRAGRARADHAARLGGSRGRRYACSRSTRAACRRSGGRSRARRARRRRPASRPSRTCDDASRTEARTVIMPIRTLGDPVLRSPAKPVDRVRPRAARARATTWSRRCTTRPASGSPGRRSASRCGCSCSTTARRGRRSWRTPCSRTPTGELLEDEGCLSIPGPYHATPRFERDHVPRPGRRRGADRDRPARGCSRGSSSTRPTTSTACSTSTGSTTRAGARSWPSSAGIELGLEDPRRSAGARRDASRTATDAACGSRLPRQRPVVGAALEALAARGPVDVVRRRHEPAAARRPRFAARGRPPSPRPRARLGLPLLEIDGVRAGEGARRSSRSRPTRSSWWPTASS